MKLVTWSLVTIFHIVRIEIVICGTVLSNFEVFRYKAAPSATEISSQNVVSMIRCATLCNINPSCMSFSYNCSHGNLERKTCQHYSSYVSNFIDLQPSSACYVQKISELITTATTTTTTPVPTTPSTTSTTGPTKTSTILPTTTTTLSTTTSTLPATNPADIVIDIVFGASDMCTSGSNRDFLVLTTQGVYVYDKMDDFTVGSCVGPLPFTSVFEGYPDIPTIGRTGGVLINLFYEIELYSEGTVYRWAVYSGRLDSYLGSRTFTSHLGTSELNNQNIKFATYRLGSTIERHFNLGGEQFYLKSNQIDESKFYERTDVVRDFTGFNMNPWSDIPADTIAVTGYTISPDLNFVLIDSSGVVYTYHIDHDLDYDNPVKQLIQQGLMRF